MGLLSAASAAALVAGLIYGSDGWAWLDPLMTSRGDTALAFAKVLCFGVAIPARPRAEAGLRTEGGASAVGRATTEGAVDAFLAMLTLDVVLTLGAAVVGG